MSIVGQSKGLWVWVLGGVLGLYSFILLNDRVFPSTAVAVRWDRAEAKVTADHFLQEQNIATDGFVQTIAFSMCSTDYLQETLGVDQTIRLLQDFLPCGAWDVRYSLQNQETSMTVRVNPQDGKVIGFSRSVSVEVPGASPTEGEARVLAEDYARTWQPVAGGVFKEAVRSEHPHRVDHSFSWIISVSGMPEVTLIRRIGLQGRDLASWGTTLEIPESYGKNKVNQGRWVKILHVLGLVFSAIFLLHASIILLKAFKEGSIRWNVPIFLGLIYMPLFLLRFLNNLPDLLHVRVFGFLPIVYAGMAFFLQTGHELVRGLIVASFAAAGAVLARQLGWRPFKLLGYWDNDIVKRSEVLEGCVAGLSTGFIMMGWAVVYFWVVQHIFHLNIPMDITYPDLAGSAMPFVNPLMVGLEAALMEETIFRLFAIAFLTRYLGNMGWAIFLSAFFWAIGHADALLTPTYFRIMELTLTGILLGVLYARYGLEASIMAHYVYNTIISGWTMLGSGIGYLKVSALVVVLLAFVPLFWVLFFWPKKNSGKEIHAPLG